VGENGTIPLFERVLTQKHPATGKYQNASECVNNKTIKECSNICYNDDECTHFWFTDDGRCCPKHSVDLTGARTVDPRFKGNFYKILK